MQTSKPALLICILKCKTSNPDCRPDFWETDHQLGLADLLLGKQTINGGLMVCFFGMQINKRQLQICIS
jgi:hypothetical protein